MSHKTVRVRFAPSPSGFMHLGNVRSALINFLFARQKEGTFVIRIEDTDQERNIDPDAGFILKDLAWLGLDYDEGPLKSGPHEPYYQSRRTALYEKYRAECQERNLIYRCFCTSEELENRRQRQLALHQPPRYDRTCLALTEDACAARVAAGSPFIWRFKLDYEKTVSFYDLGHKTMQFDLKHFSDVPITRQDGSFTFLFANFVDDKEMEITHVFRGEDHLSNTAPQVALYEAFATEAPVFWHLPILGNAQGKKLSKRDFGFSLTDLRANGYLPEAILNYLGIIGHSVEEEIMDKEKLIETFNFEHISTTGQIRYDLEKLRWMNHQWIRRSNTLELTLLCQPYLKAAHVFYETLNSEELEKLVAYIQPELITLEESPQALDFLVNRPAPSKELLESHHLSEYKPFLKNLYSHLEQLLETKTDILPVIQKMCKEESLPSKNIFVLIRIALTGKTQGLSIKDMQRILDASEIKERLTVLFS
ncbi:glutamate--tRNA ligase [Candidatus Dependentiae bacterium]|nr:glutamate--tRNA ligase [Candidatus Dependentiae bacterium]